MKLQIAIDLCDTEKLLELVSKVKDVVDIVEVGTPIIILEGQLGIIKLREKYPNMVILDDMKIVDGGKLEAGYACAAGADIVTVLACADDITIKDVSEETHKHHRKTMVDLINVTDVVSRAKEIDEMGADYICVHTASDVQKTGKNPLDELKKIKLVVTNAKLACAGGINLQTIASIVELEPEIVIIGSGITMAEDPRAMAVLYQSYIKGDH